MRTRGTGNATMPTANPGERGTATLTATLILGLLALFVAASLSRVTTEASIMNNDYANSKAFYAAQASLEEMSRNFNKLFDYKVSPSTDDILNIQNTTPNLAGFTFKQVVTPPSGPGQSGIIASGPFAGLVSVFDPWRLDSTATYNNGAEVQLTRTFFNHRVPIFQFGIFYNNDLEIYAGPTFNFGGRVHANGDIYMMSGSNVYFQSRVSAAGQIVRDVNRNGVAANTKWKGQVWIADQTGVMQELKVGEGSVINGPNTNGSNPDVPAGTRNNDSVYTKWHADSKIFGGNLLAGQPRLDLPLQIGTGSDPIEIIKRGRTPQDFQVTTLGQPADDPVLTGSRYANKEGIRISLNDSQSTLPGGTGGVRLDGASDGAGGTADADGSRGYKPAPMKDGYQAIRVNGHRLYTGPSYTDNGMPANRETWIKVEIVTIDQTTGDVLTKDITQDFLSLGVTHQDPIGLNIGDNRAILKMQRYEILGPPIRVGDVNQANNTPSPTQFPDPTSTKANPKPPINVFSYQVPNPPGLPTGLSYVTTSNYVDSVEATTQAQNVVIGGTPTKVVPFPIEMFDTREGLFSEDMVAAPPAKPGPPVWSTLYPNAAIPVVGVMSMIDIDVANLNRFLSGEFDDQFPNGLKSKDVPGGKKGEAGWIMYVSDRRGDKDDDGEYDMEDVYGPNDGILQAGEDVNHNGTLESDLVWESAPYTTAIATDMAAVFDHKYFRRGVRLINGQQLPGDNNKGFTLASENGVYILGDYNALGVSAGPTTSAPTQPDQYIPSDGNPSTTNAQVPASIAADAISILSVQWNDGNSFRNPLDPDPGNNTANDIRSLGPRIAHNETTVRAAFLMGSPMSSLVVAGSPNQGGADPCLDGGVHNFPRFLETWKVRLDYCGSLINLFNSRCSNGPYKNGSGHVYSPPQRNWVFDVSFLQSNRLPPGTPFFQFVQMTGFKQTMKQAS